MATKTKEPAERVYHWYTYEGASAVLGCTTRQLRRWHQQHKISSTRFGARVLFSREQIDEFVRNHTRGAA